MTTIQKVVAIRVSEKTVVRDYFEMIVGAIVLALFARAFVFQAFKIPSGSMEPNLLIGDHLLVDKLVFSPTLGAFENFLFAKRAPRRGDVIVFKSVEDPTRDLVKRAIGLPGDKVEIRDKKLFINDQPIDEPYAHFIKGTDRTDPDFGLSPGANWGPQTIPADSLLMLGDNRDNSHDGRFWGVLPMSRIKGRAVLVYWSYEASGSEFRQRFSGQWLKDTLSAFGRTRWSRFFHIIR